MNTFFRFGKQTAENGKTYSSLDVWKKDPVHSTVLLLLLYKGEGTWFLH